MAKEQAPVKSSDIVIDPATMTIDEQIKAAEFKAKLMEVELKQQELEAKALEIQERGYHIQDLKTRLEERALREKQIKEDRQTAGKAIAQQDAADAYRFKNCTHRKGGTVSARDMRALAVGGNGNQRAILKHQMINGDIWVRCLRCGRTWMPPVERNFFFNDKGVVVAPQDGKFDKEAFERAKAEYREVVMWETNNTMSTSVQCRFTITDPDGREYDGAKHYRENIASTTLR